MSHKRKTGGERTDKKNKRMREDVAQRKDQGSADPHHTDQPDIQEYKPGAADDRTVQQRRGPQPS